MARANMERPSLISDFGATTVPPQFSITPVKEVTAGNPAESPPLVIFPER
jgi:hypothetical protein